MNDVAENCRRVMDRIHSAAAKSGRTRQNVQLIAVTKTVSAERVRSAVESGITQIGENRLQEALSKRDALRDLRVTWHFIGHLQSNKARKVIENFDWIQSVDRSDLAEKLNQYAGRRFPILIEVKLHDEPAKSGMPPEQLPELLNYLRNLKNLDVRGLMAVPPYSAASEDSRPYFRRLRELAQGFGLAELSMGMSHDFEVAIEEGATMVRIGTALFGERPNGK
jgi:pyridoxal phosphate enzyme (YggS family)